MSMTDVTIQGVGADPMFPGNYGLLLSTNDDRTAAVAITARDQRQIMQYLEDDVLIEPYGVLDGIVGLSDLAVSHVEIEDVSNEPDNARVVFDNEQELACRPSEAIIMGLLREAPIRIREQLLDEGGALDGPVEE